VEARSVIGRKDQSTEYFHVERRAHALELNGSFLRSYKVHRLLIKHTNLSRLDLVQGQAHFLELRLRKSTKYVLRETRSLEVHVIANIYTYKLGQAITPQPSSSVHDGRRPGLTIMRVMKCMISLTDAAALLHMRFCRYCSTTGGTSMSSLSASWLAAASLRRSHAKR
jgi:hypothetical protein